MRVVKAIQTISRESQKQIFIQELLNKGITAAQDGTMIQGLDYYSLRQQVIVSRLREVDVGNTENRWF